MIKTVNNFFEAEQEISNKRSLVIDNVINSAYIKAQTPGIVPVYTGKTQETTGKIIQGTSTTSEGGVYTSTEYSPEIYNKGGIIPSGTPRWLDKAFEGSDKKIEEGMKV